MTAPPPSQTPTARLVNLQGGLNFRDLGGYETSDNGIVARGRVYRSATLHRLTAVDLATIQRLGLRVVYDLRTEAERERAPSVHPDGIRCELLPIGGTAAKTMELTDLFADGRLSDLPSDFLVRGYDTMVEAGAPSFGRLLTKLAEPDGTPGVFHCTAGKDRTGISAALLLSVLGVDEATILDDFELSAIYYTEPQMARVRLRLVDSDIDVARYRALFGAPRTAMATLLATIREGYGSVEAYLQQAAGVGPELFTQLRERLVETPDIR
jgi:protein-tyrosine phosphatase